MPGVAIAGKGTHNVVYVATMNDSVYAFDADSNSGANADPLWHVNFTNPAAGITTVPAVDVGRPTSGNIRKPGPVGIMGTPVIDMTTGTMYLVARTRETGGGCGGPPESQTFCQRLHALDITTLQERPGSPVLLGGSVPGNGNGSVGGVLTFDPKIEDQRASLALSNGRVFIAWSSHSDQMPYHGWVMAYDAATLQQTMIWTSTPC